MTVLAAHKWPTNAELIFDVAKLGYLRGTDHILDPTYEKGTWWNLWRPEKLTTLDRKRDGTDFRSLEYPDGSFDAIAFDPPYVCPGGRKTSTIPAMHARYGMAEGTFEDPDFRTPEELQQIINAGLAEMYRLVRPSLKRALSDDGANGIVVVKCMDYIWSGRLFEGSYYTRKHAETLGFECEDRFEFIGDARAQPSTNPDGSPRRQVHARRNLSTLFVLRRPARSLHQASML